MIIYKDEQYGFYELFNEENGTLVRSDVDGEDPTQRSFPELLDVGIMGHCHNGKYCSDAGIDCYQRGRIRNTPHMSVADFEQIVRQSSGKVFQIALGGVGDPNKHPNFEEILKICRYYRIVPNVTTSGFQITDVEINLIKQYCGAVAISWYSRLINSEESNVETLRTAKRFIDAGCITNVHFVLTTETLDEAIIRLKEDRFPEELNAVIFILYEYVFYLFREMPQLLSFDFTAEVCEEEYLGYGFEINQYKICDSTEAILSEIKQIKLEREEKKK